MGNHEIGDQVWDTTRSLFGEVISINGTALCLANGVGLQWGAMAHRCTPAAEGTTAKAPAGTAPIPVTPQNVEIGDHVRVEGQFYPVANMRSRSQAGGKILELSGYGLWVMTGPTTAYRPIRVHGAS